MKNNDKNIISYTVNVNQDIVKELLLEKIQETIDKMKIETVFWDRKELIRQTRMSWNTILEQFFYDPDFPKFKIGVKWYFPAEATRKFLLEWVEQNPKFKDWKTK